MKVNTRSWHFRLWRFTYSLGKDDKEWMFRRRISLCAYVQRIIWLSGLVAAAWVFVFVLFSIWVVLGSLWLLFLGQGYPSPRLVWRAMTSDEEGKLDDIFPRTAGLPIGRFRLYPYRLVLPVLGILVLAWGFQAHPVETGAVIGTSLVAALVFGIGWMIGKARDTGTYRLATAYLRAKKQKICPPIEFVRYFNAAPPNESGSIKDLRESGFKFGDASDGNPEDRSVI